MTEVMKEYEYKNKNGKSVNIKRKYTIDGASNKRKQRELDEFFRENADRFTDNVKIKALLNEYNESHDVKISYSMFYTKYRKLFGTKRERRNKAEVDNTNEEIEITDDKINEEEIEEELKAQGGTSGSPLRGLGSESRSEGIPAEGAKLPGPEVHEVYEK